MFGFGLLRIFSFSYNIFKIDKIGVDVHKMLDSQLADRGNQSDNLLPFRQQAATVARNKDMCAGQLDQVTKELRDVEGQIRHKQEILNGIVGGTILRGEELKQYVNMLRAKSSVYKQKRAELAAFKVQKFEESLSEIWGINVHRYAFTHFYPGGGQ